MYGASTAALCLIVSFITFFVLSCFLCCSDLYEFDSLDLEVSVSRDLEVSVLREVSVS